MFSRFVRNTTLSCAAGLVGLAGSSVRAQRSAEVVQQSAELTRLQDDAVRRTREYLRINTTNPPGNEVETMRWLARIFAH